MGKVLIIDDLVSFKDDVIKSLLEVGLKDYTVVDNQYDAFRKIRHEKYDLLIMGMSFPIVKDDNRVNLRQGQHLLDCLIEAEILIPVIVYDSPFYEEHILYLNEMGYPFVGETDNSEELIFILKEYIASKGTTNLGK